MTSLTAERGRYRLTGRTGPPVGQALITFAATTALLLALLGADVVGSLELSASSSSQFGVVATTTYVIAGVVAAYRAWAVRNLWAGVIALVVLGPGVAWSWVLFVDHRPSAAGINSAVLLGASTMAVVLLTKGVRQRRWLAVFGGLGSLVVGLVAALVRLDPTAADTGLSALLAAVAGIVCLYGLLADLEASEHRSLTELVESRRQIEAEVARVEDLLHDLRSGLLAIETAIGSFDDDIAVPLRAEAARLRRLTVSGARTVELFDLTDRVRSLVATRRATGSPVTLQGPDEAVAWGEESEVLAIIENLISNAERHGRSGEIEVQITADGGDTRVTVSNPGQLQPGDPEDLFRRGVSTHPDGQGLGLARARMLAGINGADLRVGPASAGRTAFVLTLRSQAPGAVA